MMHYLDYISRCSLYIIRPLLRESGLEFRLLGTSFSLISFLPPLFEDEAVVLRICGGFLVQPGWRHCGELRLAVETQHDGVRVLLQLSDYWPRILGGSSPSLIRFWFYRMTQAAIHRLITVCFLTFLYRERASSFAGVRVLRVHIREGQSV